MEEENKNIFFSNKWKRLMGEDILMMLVNRSSIFLRRPVDKDFIHYTHPRLQAEAGDFILFDFDGFFCENPRHFINEQFIVNEFIRNIPALNYFHRFIEAEDWFVRLGEGEISQGLELALRFLSIGDCAIVRCHSKYAHPSGRRNNIVHTDKRYKHDLPPFTSVIYRLHLRGIRSYSDKRSDTFKLRLANQLKLIGNDFYDHEWIKSNGNVGRIKSLNAYKSAIVELGQCTNEWEKNEFNLLLVDCFNNIAAVHLRSKEYIKAKKAASEAVNIDPSNVKALVRLAKASMLSGSFKECNKVLDIALRLEGENSHVKRLKNDFKFMKSSYRNDVISMSRRMMRSEEDLDSRKACVQPENHANLNNLRKSHRSHPFNFKMMIWFLAVIILACSFSVLGLLSRTLDFGFTVTKNMNDRDSL